MPTAQTLPPRLHDLGGGFVVRRLLPSAQRQAVGPFVFFDHFGPVQAQPGDNHDVRPHPHIGLSTVTYLFEGAMLHRDSTGAVQRMEPGQLNWMTAGRGIVHSERTPPDLRDQKRTSHGLQLWMALPENQEECEPSFHHFAADAIPKVALGGAHITVMAGTAFGVRSPVPAKSPTIYLDMVLQAGAALTIPADYSERALYALDAGCTLDGVALPQHQMQVLSAGSTPLLQAQGMARVVLVGGEPLGHRFIVWNFVSSRKERLLQAREDWIAQRFPAIAGETEFIPFPEGRA
ncbi:pirin family protein [Rhodoferax lacus]|nr:pirin family protein [Rhodoferax lacus]